MNLHFEGIAKDFQHQIVKFAIPWQARSRPKQNLRLSTVVKGKTQQKHQQKTGDPLNLICSLCFGTSIAHQLPCSQLV
jgi:hypothetical protein